MDFVITTYCNLKCQNCCNLMPYYKEPFHYDIGHIKENLKKLSNIDKINNIQILGGEPFLHPDIIEIIDYIYKLNFDFITLYTNGTVIPDGIEKILNKIDDRFCFSITRYKKSTRVDDLILLCKKYGVRCEENEFGNICQNLEGEGEWILSGPPVENRYEKINGDTCGQIMSCMGDKIYKCQRFGHLENLRVCSPKDDEWCHINEIEDKYEKLKECRFTESCKYCLRGTCKARNIERGS